ncbi:MAG TPA: acetyl-CoA carboxylase biotin carboxyl carrier protein [Flavobacterium sp.]|jgi:acetyl-CoA carboxylase biotin carboxyl carrier protein|uniref:acetyl-CoA carboxylase biotin carboxyl carrier protein n=1 Tax=Flavobacterium sp. TaxID=239 RepID=UPI001B731316|nr:acetyl-CoA carboxylase biotin carboxyl carrier protein [Flavobacterium sp.]MBA4152760.1 acetyl-CoA carboxylase biotin carboxyl carrier protein [Flavobacterium sp.]MBP6585995.1 acetyl-CoA carboxylase biotin carboxyl carrier protein [Flavobacterium sp.]HQV35983.1 acetyl-CoA carboxylase biotin carboxyl carrier protein [Flavobacterium sp.]HQX04789.1 acetyl-CoA carboxylase biotin carboxyl carrier protein [Flavobacterium sp.]HRZ31532.1 acetyl-CoA carboxylase biotin carboxyl carrier protein [Flavo
MDIREIQNLIKFVAKSGATEVKLEMDDFKITIKTTEAGAAEASYFQHYPAAQPMQQMMPQHQMPQPVAPVTPVAAPAVDDNSKYITIKSPMIGTLYRKPAPDKAPFVEVGATISKGDPVCVIEAMKLFNEIESEVSGKIIKILVDDMSPVEFDQPLFLVDPS